MYGAQLMNMKGSLPLLILMVLSTGPSHGYRIVRRIHERSGGALDFKEGTLYPALHTLEDQGLIEGFDQLEDGRTRRNYRITDRGRAALEQGRQQWRDYAQAVNLVLEGASS